MHFEIAAFLTILKSLSSQIWESNAAYSFIKKLFISVPHFATTENESVPNKDLRCLYFLCQFFIFSHSFKFLSVFIFYVPTYYLRAYAFLICLHIFYVLSFFTWLYIFLRVFIFLSVLSSFAYLTCFTLIHFSLSNSK